MSNGAQVYEITGNTMNVIAYDDKLTPKNLGDIIRFNSKYRTNVQTVLYTSGSISRKDANSILTEIAKSKNSFVESINKEFVTLPDGKFIVYKVTYKGPSFSRGKRDAKIYKIIFYIKMNEADLKFDDFLSKSRSLYADAQAVLKEARSFLNDDNLQLSRGVINYINNLGAKCLSLRDEIMEIKNESVYSVDEFDFEEDIVSYKKAEENLNLVVKTLEGMGDMAINTADYLSDSLESIDRIPDLYIYYLFNFEKNEKLREYKDEINDLLSNYLTENYVEIDIDRLEELLEMLDDVDMEEIYNQIDCSKYEKSHAKKVLPSKKNEK